MGTGLSFFSRRFRGCFWGIGIEKFFVEWDCNEWKGRAFGREELVDRN